MTANKEDIIKEFNNNFEINCDELTKFYIANHFIQEGSQQTLKDVLNNMKRLAQIEESHKDCWVKLIKQIEKQLGEIEK